MGAYLVFSVFDMIKVLRVVGSLFLSWILIKLCQGIGSQFGFRLLRYAYISLDTMPLLAYCLLAMRSQQVDTNIIFILSLCLKKRKYIFFII